MQYLTVFDTNCSFMHAYIYDYGMFVQRPFNVSIMCKYRRERLLLCNVRVSAYFIVMY